MIKRYPSKEKEENSNEKLESIVQDDKNQDQKVKVPLTKIQLKYKKIHQLDRDQRNQFLKKDIEILNRKVDSFKKKDMLFNQ